MSKLLLTVIVTTYNNAPAICNLLDSIINNNPLKLSEYEIILVDDCSPDETYNIAKNYMSSIENLQFYVEKNAINMRYPGRGCNRGFELAKGKYIHIVDGDDLVRNNIYKNLYKAKEDMLTFRAFNFNNSWKRVPNLIGMDMPVEEQIYKYPYSENFGRVATHWINMFSTKFIRDHAIFVPEKQLVQDTYFMRKVLEFEPTIKYINQIGYMYNTGIESVSNRNKTLKLVNYFMLSRALSETQGNVLLRRILYCDDLNTEQFEQIIDRLSIQEFNVEKEIFCVRLGWFLIKNRYYNEVKNLQINLDLLKTLTNIDDSKFVLPENHKLEARFMDIYMFLKTYHTLSDEVRMEFDVEYNVEIDKLINILNSRLENFFFKNATMNILKIENFKLVITNMQETFKTEDFLGKMDSKILCHLDHIMKLKTIENTYKKTMLIKECNIDVDILANFSNFDFIINADGVDTKNIQYIKFDKYNEVEKLGRSNFVMPIHTLDEINIAQFRYFDFVKIAGLQFYQDFGITNALSPEGRCFFNINSMSLTDENLASVSTILEIKNRGKNYEVPAINAQVHNIDLYKLVIEYRFKNTNDLVQELKEIKRHIFNDGFTQKNAIELTSFLPQLLEEL